MYDQLEYSNSAELCERMAAECDTAILAFSTGKDSIAAWLQLRKYFRHIVPYYCYFVPGLQFVEESLKYYEDFFGCHIYRLPHRSFFRFIRGLVHQPPRRVSIIERANLPSESEYDDDTIGEMIRNVAHLPDGAYVATGVRMADSPYRRIGIKSHGAINHNAKRFYPVYDWVKADLLQAFEESGVKMPVDYKMFGRTFDGLDYRFLEPLKRWYPEDYQRVLDWYPFAELELARWDGLDKLPKRRASEIL